MDAQVRDSPKGAEIRLLSLSLRRVSRTIRDDGGEVPDAVDLVLGQQESRQLPEVQPPVRLALKGPVVEVEAVNVEVGPDGALFPKKS